MFHCSNFCLVGFSGILKQRYTDFIVNEIDLQGNIVRLTSTAPPQYPSEMEKPQIDESAVSILLSEEEIARIKEISELPEHKKENVEIDVSNMDKEQRTFLHKYIQWVSKGEEFWDWHVQYAQKTVSR